MNSPESGIEQVTQEIKEAHAIKITPEILRGRSEVQGFTIDGPTSKDLDDAIWLEREGSGYKVTVSIADVASMIAPGSALDVGAYTRGFTRYRKSSNSPMFARELSEDLLSLHEGQVRPTVSISVSLDQDLNVGEPDIRLTVLKSIKRTTYDEVDAAIADASADGHVEFKEYAELALNLLAQRRAKGALAFYDLKQALATTEEGNLIELQDEQRHISNIIIQELMILTNTVVAEYLANRRYPTLFRNHQVAAHAPSRESILQDINKVMMRPDLFRPETLAGRLQLTYERARYSPLLEGHYGLNLPAYLHATSPIRRYADVAVMRTLLAAIKGEEAPASMQELGMVGTHLNRLTDEERDGKKQFFKERAQKNPQTKEVKKKETKPQEHETLSPKAFSKLLQQAITSQRIDENLIEEAMGRLQAESLLERDYLLLMSDDIPESTTIRVVRNIVFSQLEQKPNLAISIMQQAMKLFGWSEVQFSMRDEGPDNAKVFFGQGSITVDGQTYASRIVRATTLKLARQRVVVALLHQIFESKLDVTYTDHTQEVLAATENKKSQDLVTKLEVPLLVPADRMAKNELQHYCQIKGLLQPTYQSEENSEYGIPLFISTVTLITATETIQATGTLAKSKKDAEKLAASAMSRLLAQQKEDKREQKLVSKIEILDGNAVGALNEFCDLLKWRKPVYSFANVPKREVLSFGCVVTLTSPDGVQHIESGYGNTRQLAKHAAAKEVINTLNGLNSL